MQFNRFAPYENLASVLSPANDNAADGSHGLSHLERVWKNAKAIHAEEGGDLELIAAAVMLHDCVHVPKDSPLRASASRLAAQKARAVLDGLKWDASRIDVVAAAIESHSFSAGMTPASLEGCILQDADRLDAIGLVGIARCFYTAGRLGSQLYDALDSRAEARPLDDSRFALDHFPRKLLSLAEGFKTSTGRRLARERHRRLQDFYEGVLSEIGA
jgi:uncharacterized protein